MKPINIEKLMNHSTGISDSYYRATEIEILDDYLKVIPLTTINGENLVLRKQVEELAEKAYSNDYLIKAKLQEKDDALIMLSDQVLKLTADVQNLKKQSLR